MLIKKDYKKDPVEDLILKIPPKLIGGAFFYGKIRAGKTTAMLSLTQKYHEIFDYKIFDIHGGQRNENMYWAIPSEDVNYWDFVKKKLQIKENQNGPKQYKVNFLYPYFASKIPKRLPHNPGFVKSKLFTIPLKEIENSDIKLVANSMSDTAISLWRECAEKLKNNESGPEMEEIIRKKKGEKQIFYKNLIKPLIKEQLLQSNICPYNLNVREELKNREVISILCLKYIPPIYHLFVIGWILRQTKELLDNGKLGKKNIFIFREAGEYFRVKDDSVTDNRIKWFRKLLTDYIRYGRRGMHMFMDTQSPAETRGICEGAADLTFIGRIAATSREDRAAMADALYSVGKITKRQIEQLGDLNAGEFFIVSGSDDAKRKYALLPRSMYWKEKYKNFDDVWKNFIDKWITTEEDKKILKEDYLNRYDKMDEQKKFNKALNSVDVGIEPEPIPEIKSKINKTPPAEVEIKVETKPKKEVEIKTKEDILPTPEEIPNIPSLENLYIEKEDGEETNNDNKDEEVNLVPDKTTSNLNDNILNINEEEKKIEDNKNIINNKLSKDNNKLNKDNNKLNKGENIKHNADNNENEDINAEEKTKDDNNNDANDDDIDDDVDDDVANNDNDNEWEADIEW